MCLSIFLSFFVLKYRPETNVRIAVGLKYIVVAMQIHTSQITKRLVYGLSFRCTHVEVLW